MILVEFARESLLDEIINRVYMHLYLLAFVVQLVYLIQSVFFSHQLPLYFVELLLQLHLACG